MNMLWSYGITLVIMSVLDGLWLGLVAPAFYRSQIGSLLMAKPNMVAAVSFYLIYVFGITFFVVYPGLVNHQSLWHVLAAGALLGFFAYATYDLTNLSTLKNWTLTITIVDIIWGTVLTAGVSALAVFALKSFLHV